MSVSTTVLDNAKGDRFPVDVPGENPKIYEALDMLDIPYKGAVIRQNLKEATYNDPIEHKSTISVTQGNLKGANEILDMISDFGNADGPEDESVKKALEEFGKDFEDSKVKVNKTLIADAKNAAASVNSQLRCAEEKLKLAQKNKAEFSFALAQLGKGNVFALIKYLGRDSVPNYVRDVCEMIGCRVPDKDDPRWALSEVKVEE